MIILLMKEQVRRWKVREEQLEEEERKKPKKPSNIGMLWQENRSDAVEYVRKC